MPNITTCLWFDKEAEEAANFYVRVFSEGGRSAKIGKVARYGEAGAEVSRQPKGTVMTVEFELGLATLASLVMSHWSRLM